MSKKISLGAAVTLMFIVAAITFGLTMLYSTNVFNSRIAVVNDRESMYNKIADIDNKVRGKYIDEVDYEKVVDSIAEGYISGLNDRYAAYYNKEELEEHTNANEGFVVGIGIQATRDDSGYIRVVTVYENSSAAEVKIEKGDLIVEVNGQDVKVTGYTESVDALKGEVGSTAKIKIRRDGEERELEVTRKKVNIPSVNYELKDSNAYIQITEFNQSTTNQFKQAIEQAQEDGVTGIIFDLRDNTGGTVSSVTEILDILLPKCTIMTEVDKNGNQTQQYTSDDSEIKLPMVTLGNGKTASAAELFVAALRDVKKTEMIGVNTYGKGVMQTLITLSDGSGINITTAYFNPPSGVNFNEVGLAPDYEVTLTPDEDKSFTANELELKDDPQYKKAVEVLNAAK